MLQQNPKNPIDNFSPSQKKQQILHRGLLGTPLAILFTVAIICLVAVSCGKSKPNVLRRPVSESNTNTVNTDQGEVAGTDTIKLSKKEIKVNGINVQVDVADNDISRTQGLSGREKLDDGTGMLFDFTNSDFKKPGFWMKDMLFNIDIIWINNGSVVGITPNTPISTEDKNMQVYYPPSEITHVLEVPANWSTKNNLKVGNTVSL